MLTPNEMTTFFRIEEGTKNEVLAIGGAGRVVRWTKNDTDLGQQWCIYPVRDDLVMIQTLQNGEFLTVGDDGVYRRWARHADEKRQLFRFVNESKDGSFNIEEQTRKQYIGIGSDGTAVRWDPSGGNEQRFKLRVVSQFDVKPELEKPATAPGHILLPKALASITQPHEITTGRVLVGQELLYSIEVNDPAFASKLAQVKEHPYYRLSRYQQWDSTDDAGGAHVFSGREEETYSYKIVDGFTKKHIEEIEQTIGWTIGFDAGGKYVRKDKNGGEVGAMLKFQYENSVRTTTVDETSETHQREKVHTVRYPAQGEPCKLVEWSLVDIYEVARADGTVVKAWRTVNKNTNHRSAYPAHKTIPVEVKQLAFA